MIHWTNRKEDNDPTRNFKLFRCPRSGSLTGVIVSPDMIGTGTHFWKNRTMPCTGKSCPACRDGFNPRWYGFLGIWSPKTDRLGILEITEAASDEVDRYYDRHKTLRGAQIKVSRQGNRPNGRVLADLTTGTIDPERLPPAIDIKATLLRMWELTTTADADLREVGNARHEVRKHFEQHEGNGRSK